MGLQPSFTLGPYQVIANNRGTNLTKPRRHLSIVWRKKPIGQSYLQRIPTREERHASAHCE